MKKGLWVWGYVLEQVPGEMQFVNGKTWCSLESGADYLGADNVVFMNSMHDIGNLNEQTFKHVEKFEGVICGLQHDTSYVESAEKVSEFSLQHKNIKGAVIDDFLMSVNSAESFKPADLKKVQAALKKKNPDLKLYVVRYTWQNQQEIIPYLDYFDVLNLWVWISTTEFWQAKYEYEIKNIRKLTGKPVIQGLFVHNYGETWGTSEEPLTMETTQWQFKKSLNLLRNGELEGCIILQNGWFCRENHREQIQWIKNYTDWFYGTSTWR